MMFDSETLAYALLILLLFILAASLRIANQYEKAVVFRLGKYARISGPGLYLLVAAHRMAVHDRHAHHDDGRRAEHHDDHHDAKRIRRNGPQRRKPRSGWKLT
ncbi:MAG TPA: hypothetical protein VME69_09145 [Methylocella sp.]|nr:hypothetical protein [Methylocella sp.]